MISLRRIICAIKIRWDYFVYIKITKPNLVKNIRCKKNIRVLFVVHELSSWKSESLYLQMLSHPRFTPILLPVLSMNSLDEYSRLKKYMDSKGYNYEEINNTESIHDKFNPDIIFYPKPWMSCIQENLSFIHNLKSTFCYVNYSFRNKNIPENQDTIFHRYAWQVYMENEISKEDVSKVSSIKGINTIVTGQPFMDDLLRDKTCFNDPWQKLSGKKRIIYAPHHSLFGALATWSTFLEFSDFMLEMAEKYKEHTQWAFKPHPLLKPKLKQIWGEKKTELYYNKWKTLENSQIEEGEYMGLFKHSDAMIHDCGSFMLEYLYTNKPVMYLVNGEHFSDDSINRQTKMAYSLHYHGKTKQQIENFIQNVISEKDDMSSKRTEFCKKYLTPPNEKSACENIINAILGIKEYAQ